jgi:hypothetical protein
MSPVLPSLRQAGATIGYGMLIRHLITCSITEFEPIQENPMTEHRDGPRTAGRVLGFRVLTLALLPAWIALGGCATSGPYSYLDGYRWSKVEMDTYDTLILSVDGKSYPYNDRIKVDPGPHHIVFQTKPTAGFQFSKEASLDLDVEPCMRYWFEAKRVNALAQDFEARVNYKEPIAGCGGDLAKAPGY